MTTELYKICTLGQGSLFIMPKPSKENLHNDIKFYQSQGVTKVISLLLPAEIRKLEMTDEGDACEQRGLSFCSFSIKDMSVPDLKLLQQFNQYLKQDLLNGEQVAIHCHGGRGRAGTVAITLMVEFGFDAETAIEMACEARGDRVPVNDAQLKFVKAYPPCSI
ncbi:MAG: hypothetical protein ISEC1_P1372 [Thiomicrorhabdus sp.]|nr:MAG: hypothetical protein ISEC1_P1372 [Thiomicrorhabdus sp.]